MIMKKKKMGLLILFLIYFVSSKGQNNDLRKDNLQGRVESVIIIDNILIDPYKTVSNYNLNGNLTSIIYYKKEEDGKLKKSGENIFNYDQNNNLVEAKYYNSPQKLYNMETYKYDDNDSLIEKNIYGKNKKHLFKYTYKYSKKGKLSESFFSNLNLKTIVKCTYIYDKRDNLVEKNYSSLKKEIKNKEVLKYNNQNDLTEQLIYDSLGNLVFKYTYEYNNEGNKIIKKYLNIESTDAQETQIYNNNGKLIEIKANKSNMVCKYTYDKYGNITTTESIIDEVLLDKIQTEYIFDNDNNWIKLKRTVYSENQSPYNGQIIERIIKYFQ